MNVLYEKHDLNSFFHFDSFKKSVSKLINSTEIFGTKTHPSFLGATVKKICINSTEKNRTLFLCVSKKAVSDRLAA